MLNEFKNSELLSEETGQGFDINEFRKMQKQLSEKKQFDNPHLLKTVNLTELMDTVYETKVPIIDGLLYKGLYLFVGGPKLGKSFMMAQVGYHVSTGLPLWELNCKRGDVLYLALEDNYQRLQSRIYRMFGTKENDNFHFCVSAGHIGNGLEEQLNNFIQEYPNTSLIIIDTLQKVRDVSDSKYSYALDYEIMTRLKTFCDNNDLTILIVHHTRKQNAEDAFEMISGTNGLLGAADGAFILAKEKRVSDKAVLETLGRDQQEQRFNLMRNEKTLAWELESLETELWKEPPEPLLDELKTLCNEVTTKWQGSPTELVNALNIDIKPNAITVKLNVLAGRMLRECNIHYSRKRTHEGRIISLTYSPCQ